MSGYSKQKALTWAGLSLICVCQLVFAFTVIPEDSAQNLKTVGYYLEVAGSDLAYAKSFMNMYYVTRIGHTGFPSHIDQWIEFEERYDEMVAAGIPVELGLYSFFETTPEANWETDLLSFVDRVRSGDRMKGIRQVYVCDEPYNTNPAFHPDGPWTLAKLQHAINLTRQYFPDARTRVLFSDEALGYAAPGNLDIMSLTYFPFRNNAFPDFAAFTNGLSTKIDNFRNVGYNMPIHLFAEATEQPAGPVGSFRMPTAAEARMYYDAIEANPQWQIEGLWWWRWEDKYVPGDQWSERGIGSTTDGLALGDGGTARWPDTLAQHIEINQAIPMMEAPEVKPHWAAFDGADLPNLSDPAWTLEGSGTLTSSASDGTVYTMQCPSAAGTSYWALRGPAAVWDPWKALTTVQAKVRFTGDGSSTYAGTLGVFTGKNGSQFMMKATDSNGQNAIFMGPSDQGTDYTVPLPLGHDRLLDEFNASDGTLPDSQAWNVTKNFAPKALELAAETYNNALRLRGKYPRQDDAYSSVIVNTQQVQAKGENSNAMQIDMKFSFPSCQIRNYGSLCLSPQPLNVSNKTCLEFKFAGFNSSGQHFFNQYVNNTQVVSQVSTYLQPVASPFGVFSPNTDYWLRMIIKGNKLTRLRLSVDGVNWVSVIGDQTINAALVSDSYYVTLVQEGKWIYNADGEDNAAWDIDRILVNDMEPRFNIVQFAVEKDASKDATVAKVYLNGSQTPVVTGWTGYGNGAVDNRGLVIGDMGSDANREAGTIAVDYIAWTHGGALAPYLLLPSELDQNGNVELSDFALMAGDWLSDGTDILSDIDQDGGVDINDLLLLVSDWLKF